MIDEDMGFGSRDKRRRLDRFVCPCGFERAVSIPVNVPIESWLADYPCPACALILFPRTVGVRGVEPGSIDEAVYIVLRTLAEPGIETVDDLGRRLMIPGAMLRAAVDKIASAGRTIPDEDLGGEALCRGCGEPWPGPGWCGSCATPPGWHP